MKTLLVVIIFISGLLTGCRNNSPAKDEHGIREKDKTIMPHDDHAVSAVSVALNDGQKWAANTETTQGIANMMKRIQSIPQAPTVEDYKALQVALDNEFNSILQNCTMTGEAHDQLHNYLMPLKEMINQLGSNSIDDNKQILASLNQHLSRYGSYFQ